MRRLFSKAPAFGLIILIGFFRPTSSRASPKFGPEIELQNRFHKTGIVCAPLMKAGAPAVLFGVMSDSEQAKTYLNEHVQAAFETAATAMTVGSAVCFFNLFVPVVGPISTTERALKKIRTTFKSAEDAGLVSIKQLTNGSEGFTVEYPDKQTITFGKDPYTVEVTFSPVTSREMNEKSDFFQREIFDRAKMAGLHPPKMDGPWNGGHIHIDIEEAFNNNPQKFKNFLADFVEHSELSRRLFVRDPYSAGVIEFGKHRKALQNVFAFLDELSAAGKPFDGDALKTLKEKIPGASRLFSKRSALNLNLKLGTLEIRALRSPANASILARTMELLDRRIRYTNSLPSAQLPKSWKPASRDTWALRYKKYVEDAGLAYRDYSVLVPPKFRVPVPVAPASAGCLVQSLSRLTN